MNKKRYVISSGPVNRRTAPAHLRGPQQPKVTGALKQRMQQMATRRRLGSPLQALVTQAPAVRGGAVKFVIPAASLLAALAGWLFVPGLVGAAVASMAALTGLVAGWRAVRGTVGLRPAQAIEDSSHALDPSQLAALDEQLEAAAADAPPEVLQAIQSLKLQLVRAINLHGVTGQALQDAPGQPPVSWRVQDSAWLRQCIARYVPDSVRAYLQIDAARRADLLAGTTRNAHALFVEQLRIIEAELIQRIDALTDEAGDRLLNQHRFLQAKQKLR